PSEVREEPIARQPLEVEDPLGGDDRRVPEELHLGVHPVDDAAPRLQVSETLTQRPAEPLALDERVERRQPSYTRKARIRPPVAQRSRVRSTDATIRCLPFPPLSPLA